MVRRDNSGVWGSTAHNVCGVAEARGAVTQRGPSSHLADEGWNVIIWAPRSGGGDGPVDEVVETP
ncbi:hypothetical protein MJD09_11160, partial [bacterium]|nr:hypothetical protein [bacterium]